MLETFFIENRNIIIVACESILSEATTQIILDKFEIFEAKIIFIPGKFNYISREKHSGAEIPYKIDTIYSANSEENIIYVSKAEIESEIKKNFPEKELVNITWIDGGDA